MLVETLKLDAVAYVEEKQKAFTHGALEWYRKNKQVFVRVTHGSRVMGYVCAVPLVWAKYNEIRRGQLKDDAEIGLCMFCVTKDFASLTCA